MKLNGLTNNLKDNNSLSNSYLSHIVELLRQEVEALAKKEVDLEAITKEHIETQQVIVDTETVNAKTVNIDKINVSNINDKIILLSKTIEMFETLKVNGHTVITDEQFTGPFTYKGEVETLPGNSNAGDVYIFDNKVYISDGSTYNSFDIPLGSVSKTEFDDTIKDVKDEISTVVSDTNVLSNKLDTYIESNDSNITTINNNIQNINNIIVEKLDKNPVDGKTYVRKDDQWIDLNTADNTVKQVAGESTVSNKEDGVTITSPKVEINTPDFKVNGAELPQVDKFSLSKTTEVEDNYYYRLKFGRSPYSSVSSIQQGWCTYGNSYEEAQKAPPEKYSFFTKNWQYCKFNLSGSTGGNDQAINITAMDKDGNINNISSFWEDWVETSSGLLLSASFFSFNQEYVPEGWEDTVYMFCPGSSNVAAYSTSKPYLVELKDGDFSRKIDIYNGPGKLKEQGFVPYYSSVAGGEHISQGCGKGLRNKNIQRICWVAFNVANTGGNYAIIIGGDKNSKVTDPFDPTKAIYVPLPATAYYSYDCMTATDKAWYLQESYTGRMMRITPDGQVTEINLSENVYSSGFNYIEYTDKNNRPAAAYYVLNDASGGGHYVVFLEEEVDDSVNVIERKVTSSAFTPSDSQWYSQLFKFCENSHYIFFTASCGLAAGSSVKYGAAKMCNMLWYWDKKTHTTHAINNFYEGIPFDEHSFIEMHKTKGNAIWFPYICYVMPKASRTGELHYISDIDYTNINPDTGIDEGEIEVQTANVGTNHSFFYAGSNADFGQLYYPYPLQGNPSWENGGPRNQLSATNDDGILCIMSGDMMAYALCYGDGNIKVWECSNHDGSAGGRLDCDADKTPIIPDITYYGYGWDSYSCLFGMTHGWILSVFPNVSVDMWDYDAGQNRSYTYIGVQYRNGEPNILTEPHLTKIQRTGSVSFPQRCKFEKYGYLQTYDDYERRKKVLGEIRANLQYAVGSTGTDSYFKEVRKEVKKLNLEYNGKVISSVEQ